MKKETEDNLRLVIGIPVIFLMLLAFVAIYSVVAIVIFGTILGFLDATFGFIVRFCKVEIVCYAGKYADKPNWLGYIVLALPFIYLGIILIKRWWKANT